MKQSWFIVLLAATVLSACTVENEGEAEGIVYEQDGINMPLSLSVGASTPVTKMTAAVTQSNSTPASFRGIKQIYAIPFRVQRSVKASDTRNGPNLLLPHLGITNSFGASANSGEFSGLVENNNSHLYKNVYLRRGTGAMLVYGEAVENTQNVSPGTVAFKRRNGVLQSHGLESADNPADISFTLEPFITQDNEASFNSTVSGLLTYLNGIVTGATVSKMGYEYMGSQKTWTYNWKTFTDYGNYQTLVTAFNFITNESLGFSGGSNGLNKMLTSLYNSLYTIASNTNNTSSYYQSWYESDSRYATEQKFYYIYELAKQIRSLINNGTYVTVSNPNSANATVTLRDSYANFPDSFGVPAGCVAFIWNGTAFVQQTAATGAALAPMDAYCYPPSLWYMTNSTIRTSDSASIIEEYKSANTTWQSIIDQYTYGASVFTGAESAAVKDPLQYGVGMLEIKLKYAESLGGTQLLLDSQNNTVDVRNSNFPLTGIIIGEQKTQDFSFSPSMSGTRMYVYDSEVNEGSTPKAYIAGAASNITFQPIHTLVVQTEDAQDVHLALEFQNNSTAEFYGANANKIPVGSKFYLLATLEYAAAENSTSETLSSVFVHDRITSVTFKVNSLAKAYNTIPDLRDPQLEIGVVTKMEWVLATPSEIPMY